jgi:Radical SAM superfamily
MLTGLHFLLTYQCLFECDHCFVYSGPNAEGTFTLARVRAALDQAKRLGTITRVFFEGGEPFLYYPLLLAAVREGRARGFEVGIVSNAYFATATDDARLALEPLRKAGLTDLTLSDDELHFGEVRETPARRGLQAAAALGLPADTLATASPCVQGAPGEGQILGDVMFRGRAVEKLAGGLPRRPWQSFTECPHEELADPGRVHVDPYGHVHLCQGLLMGNLWETPLAQMVPAYAPQAHPLVGPILRGGPAELIRAYDVPHEEGYVDACHACFMARRALLERFPSLLAPRQVYGLSE